jgi:hypothetical protein
LLRLRSFCCRCLLTRCGCCKHQPLPQEHS